MKTALEWIGIGIVVVFCLVLWGWVSDAALDRNPEEPESKDEDSS